MPGLILPADTVVTLRPINLGTLVPKCQRLGKTLTQTGRLRTPEPFSRILFECECECASHQGAHLYQQPTYFGPLLNHGAYVGEGYFSTPLSFHLDLFSIQLLPPLQTWVRRRCTSTAQGFPLPRLRQSDLRGFTGPKKNQKMSLGTFLQDESEHRPGELQSHHAR